VRLRADLRYDRDQPLPDAFHPEEHLRQRSPEEQLRFKSKTGREFIAVELKVVNDAGQEIRKDEQEVGEIVVRAIR